MEIVLPQSIKNLGITESDVAHMLKACNQDLHCNIYAPSTKEVIDLMYKAYAEEKRKNRTVLKWLSLIDEFKKFTK